MLVKILKNSTIHLEHVVNDILDISRIENGKFEIVKESFDLNSSIKEVIDILDF